MSYYQDYLHSQTQLEVCHNIEIKYKLVKGHQDTKPSKDKKNRAIPLSPQAILNIHCDKRAGQYWKHPDSDRTPSQNPPMPTEVQTYYKSKDQVNISKITQQIVLHRHGQRLRK